MERKLSMESGPKEQVHVFPERPSLTAFEPISHGEASEAYCHARGIALKAHSLAKPEPDIGYRYVLQNPVGTGGQRAIIGLETRGCSYATSNGPCAICGHAFSCLWDADCPPSRTLSVFEHSLAEVAKHRPATICIYTSGSFLDPLEVVPETRLHILRTLASLPWLRSVCIESLPQFVTGLRARELRQTVPDKDITVGVGIDCSTETLRTLCTFKAIPDQSYAQAARACVSNGLHPRAYVVVKPPFLDEGEAIWEGAYAAHRAFEMGFRTVSFEPVAIQRGTVQQLLHDAGLYQQPTIWTVAQCIALLKAKWRKRLRGSDVLVGGEVFTPLPESSYPRCPTCETSVRRFLLSSGIDIHLENRDSPKCLTPCIGKPRIIPRPPTLSRLTERIRRFRGGVLDSVPAEFSYATQESQS